jgi:hypothetical protein
MTDIGSWQRILELSWCHGLPRHEANRCFFARLFARTYSYGTFGNAAAPPKPDKDHGIVSCNMLKPAEDQTGPYVRFSGE